MRKSEHLIKHQNKPGGERKGGRKKGTPNKVTQTVRESIEGAFGELGGQAYLVKVGKEEPKAFLQLLSKIIPRDLNVNMPENEIPVLNVVDAARRIAYLFAMAMREQQQNQPVTIEASGGPKPLREH